MYVATILNFDEQVTLSSLCSEDCDSSSLLVLRAMAAGGGGGGGCFRRLRLLLFLNLLRLPRQDSVDCFFFMIPLFAQCQRTAISVVESKGGGKMCVKSVKRGRKGDTHFLGSSPNVQT